ncbi:hypothetical protein SPRG_03583 [Saprolegnia parasitica CBS 223.65]|uniref:Uncharacterized protein n=1 Tax=Saprolegnia parasitica (strain CBS 223.65) TaxID=695850 RepID=A0A067CLU7_SAPPC|nr:hypothetical protein SPRG_03583 [Saprolegnia parasitica CBS 223.65]KDO31664.1 hypothetical protein SPRG_03583 [Saprolegnia parasitica CBS 223.65]|eukprot:XP_012197552.1 hypothetical protein SPRG_03583 [Saprolegnia parasitica CBS 223.65]
MAKSIRSKIKKYFRRQLRNTIGKDDLEKKQALIQENLKKTLEIQSGSTLASLKLAMGSTKAPMVAEVPDEAMVDTEGAAEAEIANETALKQTNRKDHLLKKKKIAAKASSKKKKFGA